MTLHDARAAALRGDRLGRRRATCSSDWPRRSREFTAVVPRDYKRVMEAIRAAEAAGRDVDEAVMEVARA